jgi:3-oxoacyl-[acyl-carrier protein] reductase
MPDLFSELIDRYIAEGSDPGRWWDEARIPLHTIDQSVRDLLDLSGRTAVVTGGAGINLGQACVNRLAALGASVAVVDLPADVARSSGHMRHASPPNATAVAEAAAAKWNANVIAIEGDMLDWDSIDATLQACIERLGGIDVLVNNVADTAVGEFAEYTRADIDRSVRGTFVGAVYCTRLVLDHMIPRGRGCIVNVGSTSSVTAMPGIPLYGALKAGLNGFTRNVGKEVARHGVRLNGVNPGSMWGPDRPLPADTFAGLYPRGRTAIQRYELPEEVANMVAFLASDAASSMVGTVVDMGGGQAL